MCAWAFKRSPGLMWVVAMRCMGRGYGMLFFVEGGPHLLSATSTVTFNESSSFFLVATIRTVRSELFPKLKRDVEWNRKL
jgi:hypothetical protein